jgi:hypothetical protein
MDYYIIVYRVMLQFSVLNIPCRTVEYFPVIKPKIVSCIRIPSPYYIHLTVLVGYSFVVMVASCGSG